MTVDPDNQKEFRIRALNAAGPACWPEDFCYAPDQDFNTLKAAGNEHLRGLHSQGGTMYVMDISDRKIYAYDQSTKARVATREFDLSAPTLESPSGIWSNGETMWVVNERGLDEASEINAYKLTAGNDYGTHDPDKDITISVGSGASGGAQSNLGGAWSNGVTMWVTDYSDDKLYAFKMTPGADFGDSDSGKDITLHTDNSSPQGIWSNGATIWVSDTMARQGVRLRPDQ